jgi:hypothetical protein
MDAISAAAFGLVLAACAGLRAFLPVLAAGLGARFMDLPLPHELEWLVRPEALTVFGVATVLEILGDKIPVVDHLLDSVQTLTKPALAVLAATPFLYQLSPEHALVIAIAMGAPVALGVHATKATVRAGSTVTTAGMGNPLLSLAEDVAAVVALVVGLLAPLVALAMVAVLCFLLVRLALRVRRGVRGARGAQP